MEPIEFFVPGDPVPQGSWVAFLAKHSGKAMAKPSNEKKLNAWRAQINQAAQKIWQDEPFDGPMFVWLTFRFAKLKSRPDDVWKISAPDLDKLERAVYDALTKVVYTDDARVVMGMQSKIYSDEPGVLVHVAKVTDGDALVIVPKSGEIHQWAL